MWPLSSRRVGKALGPGHLKKNSFCDFFYNAEINNPSLNKFLQAESRFITSKVTGLYYLLSSGQAKTIG